MELTGQLVQGVQGSQNSVAKTALTTADYVKPDEEITDPGILAGRRIARPPHGEEIVISGISGRFPNADNVNIFKEKLFNKVEMVDDDTRRWKHKHPEIPRMAGKINDVDKLDAGFFGIHQLHSNVMDPMLRMLLERTCEAICDAGLTLEELRGSRTGVFVAVSSYESEAFWFYEKLIPRCNIVTGCLRSMLAIQVSYFFQFQGPSYTSDSACSSSFYALEHAYKAIRENKCDNAVVGATNLCLQPLETLQFAKLGVLTTDSSCRVFDEDASGYIRSEAICAIFVQKAISAKRVLAKIVHAKVIADGFKELGIHHTSASMQESLLEDTYQEANLAPNDVTFIEAHGTGTRIGDPVEVEALASVFCQDRPNTLYIGSTKPNIGHSEPASGLCSLIKVLLGMEAESIPPNINFNTPKKGMSALDEGKIKVVTDSMPWPENKAIVGLNSFGFGGADAHIIVEWNQRTKSNSNVPHDDVPRLVCVSSRVQEGLQTLLDEVENKEYNVEFIRLIQDAFRHCITLHDQRGFVVRSKGGGIHRELNYCERKLEDCYCFFGDVIKNAYEIVQELSQIPVIASTVTNIINILNEKQLRPPTNNKLIYEDILSTIKLQIAIVDVLRKIELTCKRVYGYSIGELTCAYYTECLTLEQIVTSCHYVALAKSSSNYSKLFESLESIIQPRKKSNKWVSSSSSKFLSAEFLIETINKTPNPQRKGDVKCCCLDVGYMDALNLKIQKAVKFDFERNNSVVGLLVGLGRLYNMGQNFTISNLYPEIIFPVTRGTPHISPLIKWNHKKKWFVTGFETNELGKRSYSILDVDLNNDYWKFAAGHVIDGRILFPATGYLHMVWITFAATIPKMYADIKIVFENLKFLRATTINSIGTTTFFITIHKGTGLFEICQSSATVVTGRIYEAVEGKDDIDHLPKPPKTENDFLMNEHDIYKELKLRGYQYKGVFRGIEECRSSTAKLKWNSNWISFMDCMLQFKIVENDTRNLYVPTGIERLVIDAPAHSQYLERTSAESIEVHNYKELNIIKSEHIEIKGIHVACISRKKPVANPVLESNEFVPNHGTHSMKDAIRINTQIILENNTTTKFKAVEIYEGTTEKPLATYVDDALSSEPLVQPNITILSENKVEDIDISIKVARNKIGSESNMLLVMGHNLLQDGANLTSVKAALADNGFILTVESITFAPQPDLTVITRYNIGNKLLILLRKLHKTTDETTTMFNLLNKMNWLSELQSSITENPKLVVFAKNSPISGILGFIKCLRREPNTKQVRCMFVMDDVQYDDEFYASQLAKGLAINVYKDGTWGTYRHLLLECDNLISTPHSYLSILSTADFSTFRWIEGPLTIHKQTELGKKIIKVCCSTLNFRDIVIASGRLSVDAVSKFRSKQSSIYGFEFTGLDKNGERVMGIVQGGALSSLVEANKQLLWKIPKNWTMEDAATVPIVYCTVLFALLDIGRIKIGSSILIHAGSGGVGLAAINVALYYGCKIFTTVGNPAKREFLRKQYPQIKPQNIGNSRDTSFEQMIFKETGGKGVDLVLNSLSDEKFIASVRCLATGGRYLEIGKFDLDANNPLHLELARKQASFCGVSIDDTTRTDHGLNTRLWKLLQDGINQGYVKPLPKNIFKMSEIENAFRFMAAGKHIGKIVIRVRKEDAEITTFSALPRYYCEPKGVYVVLGGLGGFGMELSDWLILRGAKKIVLTSRSGFTNGYQKHRVRIWKSYGVQVKVCKESCCTEESCENLLRTAAKLGPIIGIFNLAVVLKDKEFENMVAEDFELSFLPKYKATSYLDMLSRIYCPQLRDFVVFSSVSCGRGNIGQTNYGMSNSFMERICENRKKEGLPALVIQWGAVGDVGLVAELQKEQTEIAIGGTLQQRITSCLAVMDVFIRQEKPVVASMIVAQKNKEVHNNILYSIMQILGVRDTKTINIHVTFPELGMDSIMSMEIKQTLERDHDIFLTPQNIRTLTFAKLIDLTEKGVEAVQISQSQRTEDELQLFLGRSSGVVKEKVLKLKTALASEQKAPGVVVLPGIEGYAHMLTNLATAMKNRAVAYQHVQLEHEDQGMTDIAANVLKMVGDIFDDKTFTIVAHSFGVYIALEMCVLLERNGCVGKVAILDGSPAMCYKLCKEHLYVHSDKALETGLMNYFMSLYAPSDHLQKLQGDLFSCHNFEERITLALKNKPSNFKLSDDDFMNLANNSLKKIKFLVAYKFTGASKLKSIWKLYRTKADWIPGLSEDYGLSEYVENSIEIKRYDGNHNSILNNEELIDDVTAFVA